MSKQVIVDQISLSELKELIEVTVAEELRKFVAQTNESTDPTCRQKAEMLGIKSTILTRNQTAKLLGVSLPLFIHGLKMVSYRAHVSAHWYATACRM